MPSIDDIHRILSAHKPHLSPSETGFRAAVALIIDETAGDLRILFIERAKKNGDPWSGHIAFPGGRVESGDATPRMTAERETKEETGLDLSQAEYLGRLNDLTANVHPALISGFVYHIETPAPLSLNEEVVDAFWTPAHHLIDTSRSTTYRIPSDAGARVFPAIDLLGPGRPVLWGLTYRFAMHFLNLVGIDTRSIS